MSFKESEPVELWSGQLVGAAVYPDFERTVRATAAGNGQRYTGYIEMNEDQIVRSFTRTRYPRKKYGIASIDECIEGMEELAEDLSFELRPDQQTSGFRVVLGLIEGYDPGSPTHTVEEVRTTLGEAVSARQATVFAVRHSADDVSVYTEPVAVLQGAMVGLHGVYELADSLRQERFTVENFDNRTTYTVETRFCTEPDEA